MSYVIKNGRLHTHGCEINVTHHCNLSCRGCAHLSPVMPKVYTSPAQIYEDLSVLAKYMQADHVRLLGGEPLLHPDLIEVIAAARRSGLSERIRVVTNGIILWRMTDAFWEGVDEVHVSVYPGSEMTEERLALVRENAIRFGVDLHLLNYRGFRESYSEIGTTDYDLARRIYKTCQVAHQWRCYNVSDGYFYKCPQALFVPRVLEQENLKPPTLDGVRIVDSPSLFEDLKNYLGSPEPLTSCYYCLGTVGKFFPSEQKKRAEWRAQQRLPSEEMLDRDHLRVLEEVDPDADDLCVDWEVPDKGYHPQTIQK